MSKIDPKWIQIDDNKLEIIDNNGVNELSIKEDTVIAGLNATYVNNIKIQIFTATEVLGGDPVEEPGRDMKNDFWIQVPDFS